MAMDQLQEISRRRSRVCEQPRMGFNGDAEMHVQIQSSSGSILCFVFMRDILDQTCAWRDELSACMAGVGQGAGPLCSLLRVYGFEHVHPELFEFGGVQTQREGQACRGPYHKASPVCSFASDNYLFANFRMTVCVAPESGA